MPNLPFPKRAVRCDLPAELRLLVVTSSPEPPTGEGWLHEIKHDGHRLLAVVDGRGNLTLRSRNSYDRTHLFRAPFETLRQAGRELVLDGEIAVPDQRGVTHIDSLNRAMSRHGDPDDLAYFAFDLLFIDGHDLRGCPLIERKELLRRLLDDYASPRLAYVDHILGKGSELFEAVRRVGAEGIVSKRVDSPYRSGENRDWRKTKCHQTGLFEITGFKEIAARAGLKRYTSPRKWTAN